MVIIIAVPLAFSIFIVLLSFVYHLKMTRGGDWRDGSVVKSADCSSDCPEFKSQQPHGGSQPSVCDLMPSSEDNDSVLYT